jgi:hypothetical protein
VKKGSGRRPWAKFAGRERQRLLLLTGKIRRSLSRRILANLNQRIAELEGRR